jgi:hypothetical protein
MKFILKILMFSILSLLIVVGVSAYTGLVVTAWRVGWSLGYFPKAQPYDDSH